MCKDPEVGKCELYEELKKDQHGSTLWTRETAELHRGQIMKSLCDRGEEVRLYTNPPYLPIDDFLGRRAFKGT